MIKVKRCIVCGGGEFYSITDKGRHFSGEVVVECKSCGMVNLSPRMTHVELDEYYAQNIFSKQFRGSEIPDEKIISSREKRAEKKLSLIEPYLKMIPEGPILEIGCSSGYLLNKIRNKGYKVYGIDPSSGFVQYAKQHYGLKVVTGMFPDALPKEWDRKFSMIIALHVLEHTDDPVFVLNSIRNMLMVKNGGLLVLEVPDVERVVSMRKYLHNSYFQKSHIWDFSGITIKLLLEKCGFNVFVCKYYSNVSPDDKNVFLVAGKTNDKLATLEETKENQSDFAKTLYWRLKYKLLIGKIVTELKKMIKSTR